MNRIEKQLTEAGQQMKEIKAPDELKGRLKATLQTIPSNKPRHKHAFWKFAIAAVILVSLIGYNYNALAYYSKKLTGFDGMLSGTLSELNKQDMGQIIEKTIQLENGIYLTINGIMADTNQSILFYTLTDPDGLEEDVDMDVSFSSITGFWTKSRTTSGTANFSQDGTELKGIANFKAVSPLAKTLTLHIWYHDTGNELVQEEISFSHNPNKAMQAKRKIKLDETIDVDLGKVTFQSITASPTTTIVEGSLKVDNFDRFDGPFDKVQLLANGIPVSHTRNNSTSSLNDVDFELSYDALPDELETLELAIKQFPGYKTLNEKVKLDDSKNKLVKLQDAELLIKEIKQTAQGLEITIATDDTITLDGISVQTEKNTIPLKTIANEYIAMQINATMMKERTLLFETDAKPDYLLVEGMHYMKTYDKAINIPIK